MTVPSDESWAYFFVLQRFPDLSSEFDQRRVPSEKNERISLSCSSFISFFFKLSVFLCFAAVSLEFLLILSVFLCPAAVSLHFFKTERISLSCSSFVRFFFKLSVFLCPAALPRSQLSVRSDESEPGKQHDSSSTWLRVLGRQLHPLHRLQLHAVQHHGKWTTLTHSHSVSRLLQSSGGPEGRRCSLPPSSCSVGGHRQEV